MIMRKIVFFSGGINRTGGTERALACIANGLAKENFDVILVSLCGNETYYTLDESIKVFFLHSKSLSSDIVKNLRTLSDIVCEEKPDYWVDVDNILGVYTERIRKKRPEMKWISWEHFCFFYDFPYYGKLREIIRKKVCKKADCVLVLSDEDKKDYFDNIKEINAKLCRIYNPIPYDSIGKSEQREKIIFAAGRLTKIKGFDMLIEAWSTIEKDCPEWKLLIAGDGEEKDNLLSLIKNKNLQRAELLGYIDEIEDYYKKTSIFALSSRNEGFVMVLLEAMSFGLPCIAFDCKCGIKEMIDDQRNGFVIEAGNVREYSDRLKMLMQSEELRNEMADNSISKIQGFTQEKIVQEWVKLIDSI